MATLPDLSTRDYPRSYSKGFGEKLRKQGREANMGNRNYRIWYGDVESKDRDSSDVNVGEQRAKDAYDDQPKRQTKKRTASKKRSGKRMKSRR